MTRIVAFLLTLAMAAPAAHAEKVLRLSTQLALSHPLGQNLVAFKDGVETESRGEIRIEIYSAGALHTNGEVPAAVAAGTVEMGAAQLTELADRAPAVELFYVPFLLADPAALRQATAPEGRIRRALDEAIAGTGMRALWWQAAGGTVIVGRRQPIVTPSDVRGKRVRVVSPLLAAFVESLGGTPVDIPGAEQYGAYARDQVDAGLTGVTAVTGRALYEPLRYLTVTSIAPAEFVVLINGGVWAGLARAQQSVIERVARRVEAEHRNGWEQIEAAAFAEARRRMTVIEPTEAEREAWRQAAAPMADLYVQRAGPLGRELLETARALR